MAGSPSTPERGRVLAGLVAEASFGVLPLIVVLLVVLYSGHSGRLFASPEWAFGASILFGQGLVKFAVGIGRGGSAANGPVALAVTLLVVLGLAPSLLILMMVLQSVEAAAPVPAWLCAAQVVFFVASIIVYLLFGAVGELWGPKRRGS
jgi:hypothetical protein